MTAYLAAWAWWSKSPGSGSDYSVLASDLEQDQWVALSTHIKARAPSNPPRSGRPDVELPWLVVAGEGGPAPSAEVLCWDWTGGQDVGGRPILGLLYLRLEVSGPVSLERVAGYARAAWASYRDRPGQAPPHPAALDPTDPEDLLATEEDIRWAASVAALTLCQRVRVDGASLPPGRDPARLLDGVTALLPAPVRARLAVCFGTTATEHCDLTVGRRGGTVVRAGVQPDLSGAPAAQAYAETLDQLRRHYRIGDIARHLAAVTTPAGEPGPAAARAACADLAAVDPVTEIGAALLSGHEIDVEDLRKLAAAYRLADQLGPEAHLAWLTQLLVRGGPDAIPAVTRNWRPEARDAFVTAFLTRAERETLDRDWIVAAVDLLAEAGPDELLVPLLERHAPRPELAALLTAVAERRKPAHRARDWLISRPEEVQSLVPSAGDELYRWLGAGPHPPAWSKLLIMAVTGHWDDTDAEVDPWWLLTATELAAERHPPRDCLRLFMAQLLVPPPRRDEDPVGRWLLRLPLDDAADRADGDFVLLATRNTVPPGLKAGSAAVRSPVYVDQLVRMTGLHPLAAPEARRRLPLALAREGATADALDLLERLAEAGWAPADELRRDAAAVLKARPELGGHDPGPDDGPTVNLGAGPSDVAELARGDADGVRLGQAIVDARRAGVDPRDFRGALAEWAGLRVPDRLDGLVREIGRLLDPGGARWRRLGTGYALVAHILPHERRRPLLREVEKLIARTDEKIVDEYADLHVLRRMHARVVAADRAGRTIPLSPPPEEEDSSLLTRIWGMLLRRRPRSPELTRATEEIP